MHVSGRRVVVLGLARQGMALVRFLAREGADVLVSDLRRADALYESLETLRDVPARYVFGEHPASILDGAELVCLSGGVPLDAPIVIESIRRGIPLSNDAQLFLERCPAPVIGITGSSGKTTTSALLGRMLQRARFMTWIGGNIGRPLLDQLWRMNDTDRVVVELSSFQLELMTVSPDVAALLNLTPNHLDRHRSMDVYAAAKQRILDYQQPGGLAVLCMDDRGSWNMRRAVRGRLAVFGASDVRTDDPSNGVDGAESAAYLRNESVMLRLEGKIFNVCHTDEIKLLGWHNTLNVLAASVLAGAAGVPIDVIRDVATTFSGVEHRLELVRTLKGVRYYDDSIATAPERTVAALKAFEVPVVLLAGGRDKALPWEEMARVTLERARYVVAFGEAAGLVEQTIDQARTNGRETRFEGVIRVGTLDDAVVAAAQIARPGEVVLLAPGGTSFDAFRDFAERGERFQALVRELQSG